jgi:hypothetical protein
MQRTFPARLFKPVAQNGVSGLAGKALGERLRRVAGGLTAESVRRSSHCLSVEEEEANCRRLSR